MATDYFLYDAKGHHRNNKIWFQTRVKRQGLKEMGLEKEAQFYDCLVIHSEQQSPQHVIGLMFKREVAFATHAITLPDGAKKHSRQMVKVREKEVPIDPFDFSYGKQSLLSILVLVSIILNLDRCHLIISIFLLIKILDKDAILRKEAMGGKG